MRLANVAAAGIGLSVTLLLAPTASQAQGAAMTPEEQLKAVQDQLALLTEQTNLLTAQQTAAVNQETALATALKSQVDAEASLQKAREVAAFAKLQGIKDALAAIGPPPGKEGTVSFTAGTPGTMLLKLKRPMLSALAAAANDAAEEIVPLATGKPVSLASEADVQAAVQAATTFHSIGRAVKACIAAEAGVSKQLPGSAKVGIASVGTTAAAASLVLKTVTDFSKFFRSDLSLSVFDGTEEANRSARLYLEDALAGKVQVRNLAEVVPKIAADKAEEAYKSLATLQTQYERASATLAEFEKLAPEDKKKIAENDIRALREAVAGAKSPLDTLSPASKADSFMSFAAGLYKQERIAGTSRLTLTASAQVVQTVRKRVLFSDKIEGTGAVQLDYRLVDENGDFKGGASFLAALDAPESEYAPKLHQVLEFPIIERVTDPEVSRAIRCSLNVSPQDDGVTHEVLEYAIHMMHDRR
jgi:hypothetical protein